MFRSYDGGSRDIFVVKLDSSGNLRWAEGMGGSWPGWGTAIAVDGAGNVYTTGRFGGMRADFDPAFATSFPLDSRDSSFEVFVSGRG